VIDPKDFVLIFLCAPAVNLKGDTSDYLIASKFEGDISNYLNACMVAGC
jgi:hypothetical protein